ncbi:hypothetical protein AB3S75_036817 [Citrus x aurantiifolia]
MIALWILLLAFQFRTTSCQTAIGWLNVDCGSDVPRIGPNLLLWGTDEDFTKFGIDKRVPERQPLEEMSTGSTTAIMMASLIFQHSIFT